MIDGSPENEYVFIRGSHKAPGETVPRRFLEALTQNSELRTQNFGSGRLELARQMTDPAVDPFLPRVMVNRVWHHLFGRGIVASTDNFGVLGERPTHPELLDHLADRFVKEGWSVKQLIRALVLSSTYRMSSRPDESADRADPDDVLLHRMRHAPAGGRGDPRRDAGRLGPTVDRLYGPPVPVHLTAFQDGRGRPASGPVGRRRPPQSLSLGAAQFPVAVPARLRHAESVFHGRPPHRLQRAGPVADSAERSVRRISRPSCGRERVLAKPGSVRADHRHVRKRVRCARRPRWNWRRAWSFCSTSPQRRRAGASTIRPRGRTSLMCCSTSRNLSSSTEVGPGKPGAYETNDMHCGRFIETPLTRRDMLLRCANGFGAVALAALLAEEGRASAPLASAAFSGSRPQRHLPVHGRRPVAGGHLRSQAAAGQVSRPRSALRLQGRADAVQQRRPGDGLAVEVPPARPERPAVSDLFPHVAECIDDLCLIRSMVSKFPEHTSANYFLHTGSGLQGRPSMGAWISYGLGSLNKNLPGFIVLNGGLIPPGGLDNFNSGFLPAAYQGSVFRPADPPVANIRRLEATDDSSATSSTCCAVSTPASPRAAATPTPSSRPSPITRRPTACRRPCPS